MLQEQYMKRCLELAHLGVGQVAPNPMVGAVLVHNDRIISEGWHHAYGDIHAEIDCFDNVAAADRHLIQQSTLYVNLEPCAHTGKTPPCARRIVNEKVKKVVIANSDPFDQVSGKGIRILEEAGVVVEKGLLCDEGSWLNRRFFCFHTNKRPYIILKWAQTPDGYFAPADKSRFQITNTASQQLVHKWRTEESAVLVGTETAINDDPRLTSRLWQGRQPLRIVLDRTLKVPETHHLFDRDAPTWVINEQKQYKTQNVSYFKCSFNSNLLPQLLVLLHDHNIQSLIVEGGAQLLGSFLQAQLWDEARIFTGKKILGDGVAAPLIVNGVHSFATSFGGDRLDLFVHTKSTYQYVPGSEL